MTRSLFFHIVHPDGRREELTVDSDRVWVGSGARCEIRLAVEQAQFQHLVIADNEGTLVAEACGAAPVLVKGRPFARGLLAPATRSPLGRRNCG